MVDTFTAKRKLKRLTPEEVSIIHEFKLRNKGTLRLPLDEPEVAELIECGILVVHMSKEFTADMRIVGRTSLSNKLGEAYIFNHLFSDPQAAIPRPRIAESIDLNNPY